LPDQGRQERNDPSVADRLDDRVEVCVESIGTAAAAIRAALRDSMGDRVAVCGDTDGGGVEEHPS
jgi:hypothetical protein